MRMLGECWNLRNREKIGLGFLAGVYWACDVLRNLSRSGLEGLTRRCLQERLAGHLEYYCVCEWM